MTSLSPPCHSEEVCKTDVGIRVLFFVKRIRITEANCKTFPLSVTCGDSSPHRESLVLKFN
ncbi:MAG: hypothetical protein IKM29_02035, partial [Clostridia bacterium]|nr:hypothetical protein [Clostridia bacterium]